MEYEFIVVEQSTHIALLTLNRPDKRNAMHGLLVAELTHALKQLASDDTIRVLIIQGNGDNFCAGGDVKWMQLQAEGSPSDNEADAMLLAELLYLLYHFPKPTLALAHGVTLGGGVGLLSACDVVVASDEASFGFSEVKLGIAPSVISPYVIDAIGQRAALYYFLTGETFNVETAFKIGLVHQIVAETDLLRTGAAIAKRLLRNSPYALMSIKSLVREIGKEKISPALTKKTAKHLAALRVSSEAAEGLKAFIEKRDPKWR